MTSLRALPDWPPRALAGGRRQRGVGHGATVVSVTAGAGAGAGDRGRRGGQRYRGAVPAEPPAWITQSV